MAQPGVTAVEKPDLLTLLAFGATVLLGGTNFVAVRFSNRELAPFWGAASRFLLAAVLLAALVLVLRLPLPRGGALVGALIFGVLNFTVSYALIYYALVRMPAAVASTILAAVPLATFLLAFAHRLEPFRWRRVAGALIAVGGIAVLSRAPVVAAVPILSLLAAIGCVLAIGEGTVVVKFLPRAHPISTNAVAMAVGSLLLLAISAVSGERWVLPHRTETWIAFVYLAVGSCALFVLFLYVVRRWTASATSYGFVLNPIVTALMAALLAGEALSWALALGAGIVILGVYVGALAPARAGPARA